MSSIVVDTNVLLSGLQSRRGASHLLLQELEKGTFDIDLSVPLVFEYEDVLARNGASLPYTPTELRTIVNSLVSIARLHEIYFLWRPVLSDPKDDLLLELAVSARSAAIVTFNVRHFRTAKRFGIQAVTPLEFLRQNGVLP